MWKRPLSVQPGERQLGPPHLDDSCRPLLVFLAGLGLITSREIRLDLVHVSMDGVLQCLWKIRFSLPVILMLGPAPVSSKSANNVRSTCWLETPVGLLRSGVFTSNLGRE